MPERFEVRFGDVQLVDHHCHGVVLDRLTGPEFELLATESSWPPPPGTSTLDSPLGVTIRAVCGPLLGLPRHAPAADYLARRNELGPREASRLLIAASATDTMLIDTGFQASAVAVPEAMAELSGALAFEVVRLEALAEEIAPSASAQTFETDFRDALAVRAAGAVGVKSIAAYRCGLDIPSTPPTSAEVTAAAGRYLRRVAAGDGRLDDPVLIAHLVWTGIDLGKPVQIHVGYGDPDIVLHRCDPSLLTPFLHATRARATPIMLLHCYPYIRESAILAQLFPHVYLDVSAAVNHTGPSGGVLIGQAMEIAPFHKVLYASDAFGLAELYACGAQSWWTNTVRTLQRWIDDDLIAVADAGRYLRMMGRDNACRVYGLGLPTVDAGSG